MEKAPHHQKQLNIQTLSSHETHVIEKRGALLAEQINKRLGELDSTVVEGCSSNGLVRVSCNGQHEILDINLDALPVEYLQDKKRLSKLICEAIKSAKYNIDLLTETEIAHLEMNSFSEVLRQLKKPGKVKKQYKDAIFSNKEKK